MKLALFVLCCVNVAFAGTYKAAVIYSDSDVSNALSLVYEAAKENVDIMLLPSEAFDTEDYDENVKILSRAAKQAGLYLVAHLKEKTRCQNKMEIIRSNLVFDRQGSIIAVYRKQQNSITNCTVSSGLVTFDTDFGLTFGVMMEEDLVLSEMIKDVKNFVVAGAWSSKIPYLSAPQFAATWSFTNAVNLVSPSGIYAGKAGLKTALGKIKVAELKNDCDENVIFPPVIDAVNIQRFPGEDLSQYIIRPLDEVASIKGYRETVCHNSFCCEFDLKTSSKGKTNEGSFVLAAFNGIRHFGGGRYIGAQNCALFACAGLHKSCNLGSVENITVLAFEKLTISADFTNENETFYPVILSNQELSAKQFKTVRNGKTVTMTVTDGNRLLTFGLFGRVFDRDYESYSANENSEDFYNYIFSEDVQEFFDYVWIRVRILMFIVSIYILEML